MYKLKNGKIEKTTVELDGIITKEFLEEYYVNKNLPKAQIARIVGCDSTTIDSRLRKFNFRIKTIGESKMGTKFSKETCRKISEIKKGHIVTEEVRKKISEANKGKKDTEETKKKKSIAHKNRPSPNKGKSFSKKHKENISKALKGRKQSSETLRKKLSKIQASPNNFETKCLSYLNKLYPNKFNYTGEGTLIINGYSVDAFSKELGIVCLFHGTYWHCNPKKYLANYFHKQIKKTAQEIWNKDKQIIEILKQAGYRVIVLWEDEVDSLIKENKDPLIV